MQGPEKNSYKEFGNEKKFLRLENSPPPPHNFSNKANLISTLGSCLTGKTTIIIWSFLNISI